MSRTSSTLGALIQAGTLLRIESAVGGVPTISPLVCRVIPASVGGSLSASSPEFILHPGVSQPCVTQTIVALDSVEPSSCYAPAMIPGQGANDGKLMAGKIR